MNDTERKEESWIRKLPSIIVVLAVLIFIIIVIRDHNQYIKWKEDQSNLTGKVKQTSEELAQLKEASGNLADVTKKVEQLEQEAADLTAAIEKLTEEKNKTELTLAGLRQELINITGQVSASRNRIAELMKENENLETTNQVLRDDIVNKKGVLDSIAFLQRQKSALEQNIQNLEKQHDLAVKAELVQQAKLEALQKKIKKGEAAIRAQSEQHTALSDQVSALTAAIEKLSSQKEKLENWDDHQKRLEYLEHLQSQKKSLEISINNLLETAKNLENENSKPQQNAPPP